MAPPRKNQIDPVRTARRAAKVVAKTTRPRTTTPRRTQAERREATRTALLDAAIKCLSEDGYANLTTRRVSERAGLSQGIQMHYFPTKSHLLTEAVRYVAGDLAKEILSNSALRSPTSIDRRDAALDAIWEIHKSEMFQAGLQLWMAAPTEPELHSALQSLERDISRLIGGVTSEVFPKETSSENFWPMLDAAVATVRGLAMLVPVTDPEILDKRWLNIKNLLLQLSQDALDEIEAAKVS